MGKKEMKHITREPPKIPRSYKKVMPEKVKEAMELYLKGYSVNSISKKLKISRGCVTRYKNNEDWDAKKMEIARRVEKKVENTIVADQARFINLGRLLQSRGMQRVRMIPDDEISASDAMGFIREGIKIEKEATGQGERVFNITIKMPEGYEDL